MYMCMYVYVCMYVCMYVCRLLHIGHIHMDIDSSGLPGNETKQGIQRWYVVIYYVV
jgi:hypothetical protein